MTEDLADGFITHLEFLGFTVTRQEDGWYRAVHPNRCDFLLHPTSVGIRLWSAFRVGVLSPPKRLEYLEFVNEANDRAYVAKFSMSEVDGRSVLRARALIPSEYSRVLIGVLLEGWREDLDMLRHSPDLAEEADEQAAGAELESQDEVQIH